MATSGGGLLAVDDKRIGSDQYRSPLAEGLEVHVHAHEFREAGHRARDVDHVINGNRGALQLVVRAQDADREDIPRQGRV